MIELTDIQGAQERIRPHIHRTPILTNHSLNAITHRSLFFKAEHLQRTGSFKIRGAMNTLLQLPDTTEICAVSSGNHGQAVAYAASILGKHATIIMPEESSPSKVAATQSYGAAVIQQGVTVENREERVQTFVKHSGATLVHPFNDERVIAGQGTIALEVLEDLDDVDAVLVAVGGGGLISGISTAIKQLRSDIEVIGIEPELANDAQQSMAAHKRIRLAAPPITQADAVRAMEIGALTFPILERYVDRIVTVSEDHIHQAHRLFMDRTKQLIEPTAALPLAATMWDTSMPQRLCLIICGGNWDAFASEPYMTCMRKSADILEGEDERERLC